MWKGQHYFIRKRQHTILDQNQEYKFVDNLYIISVSLTPAQTLAILLIWETRIAEKGSGKTIYWLSLCFPLENLLTLKLEKAPKVQILVRNPPLNYYGVLKGFYHCPRPTAGCYKLLWFSTSSRSVREAVIRSNSGAWGLPRHTEQLLSLMANAEIG